MAALFGNVIYQSLPSGSKNSHLSRSLPSQKVSSHHGIGLGLEIQDLVL